MRSLVGFRGLRLRRMLRPSGCTRLSSCVRFRGISFTRRFLGLFRPWLLRAGTSKSPTRGVLDLWRIVTAFAAVRRGRVIVLTRPCPVFLRVFVGSRGSGSVRCFFRGSSVLSGRVVVFRRRRLGLFSFGWNCQYSNVLTSDVPGERGKRKKM